MGLVHVVQEITDAWWCRQGDTPFRFSQVFVVAFAVFVVVADDALTIDDVDQPIFDAVPDGGTDSGTCQITPSKRPLL